MALSTGRNEICSSVVRRHFQPGMEELVGFAHSLIEAQTDLSMCHKMKGHIARASWEMGEALEELTEGLQTIDAKSAQLIVQKNRLEEERQAQAQERSNLRHQLDSHTSQKNSSREMLETARKHLEEMNEKLSQKEEEIQSKEQIRDLGLLLMCVPLWGTIPGGIMAAYGQIGLESARDAKRDAKAEVSCHSKEVHRLSTETDRLQKLIQEAEAKIQNTERRLSSIEREKQQLASQQAAAVMFQKTLRKCVHFLAVLAGKVDVAEFLSRDVVIYDELEMVLEEILNHVFPLVGQGKETCLMALSTSEIRALIGRLKAARERLSLEGPRPGWRNVAIDF